MSVVLPKSLKYDNPAPIPSDMSAYEVVLQPTNASTFAPNSMIEFANFPSVDGIDPSSLYLNFNITYTGSGTIAATDGTRGLPGISSIVRHEVAAGSYMLESINEYGLLYQDLVRSTMSQAQIYGMQAAFGVTGTITSSDASWDSYLFPAGTGLTSTVNVAYPIVNMISNCEGVIFPAFLTQNLQMRFFLDTAANHMYSAAGTGLNFSISNVELRFRALKLPANVKSMVQQQATSDGKLLLKTSSYQSLAQTLNSGAVGSSALVYNMRFASVKNLIGHFATPSKVSGKFGSSRPTATASGTYTAVWEIGGMQYPNRPLTDAQLASEFLEVKKAWGSLTGGQVTSIGLTEYSERNDTTDTLQQPSKHYIACNTEVVDPSSVLLSGISTENSPINLRITNSNALTAAMTVYTIVNYDAILEIDLATKSLIARY